MYNLEEIIYVFLTIFLYLLKCPQSLILSALRAFAFVVILTYLGLSSYIFAIKRGKNRGKYFYAIRR